MQIMLQMCEDDKEYINCQCIRRREEIYIRYATLVWWQLCLVSNVFMRCALKKKKTIRTWFLFSTRSLSFNRKEVDDIFKPVRLSHHVVRRRKLTQGGMMSWGGFKHATQTHYCVICYWVIMYLWHLWIILM